jgi:1-deoxy-D-xylulose-5-phosphate reductoisomerase
MKNIAVLGSTGSIGTQTLEVVDIHEELKIIALSANKSLDKVFLQCMKYKPELVAMMDEQAGLLLEAKLKACGLDDIQVVTGMQGLIRVATYEKAEIIVTAVVGMIGLVPTIEAIKCGKTIALANKETLVTAGEIIMPMAKKYGVKILPVDSEHSAIYQSIGQTPYDKIEKVILTASGGPFRGKTREDLRKVTLKDALKHPNWEMGAKITIDSSTLMNKGLEVIEAKWLFDVEANQIDVVVHPQSILHSMVQYIDGSCIGQMGLADMRLPIQFALFEEERKTMPYERLDLKRLGQLTFEEADKDTFQCLNLAYEALRLGGEIPTVLNAANEKAVALFIEEKIAYLDIASIIEESISAYVKEEFVPGTPLTIERVLSTEQWTYKHIKERWQL